MKHLFIIPIALILFPLEVFAMQTPLFGTIGVLNNSTATRYFWLQGGATSINVGTESQVRTPFSVAGEISNMRIVQATAPGGTASVAYTVMKNGSATSMTCTVDSAQTSCTDLVNTVSVSPSDRLSLRVAPTNTPTASTFNASYVFTSTNANESPIMGGSSATLAANLTRYWFPFSSTAQTVEASSTMVMPTGGVLDDLYAEVSTAPGVGATTTITVYENNSATSVSCDIVDTATTCNDLTDTLTITAGEVISIQVVSTASAASAFPKWGLAWRPTVDGESIVAERQTTTSNGTRYNEIQGQAGNNGSENLATTTVPVAFTLKKLYLNLSVAPGAGTSRTWTARKNSATQTLTATVSGTNTTGSDPDNSDSYAVGDLINWITTVSGSAVQPQVARVSAVMYIAPTATTPVGQPRILNLGTMLLRLGTLILR